MVQVINSTVRISLKSGSLPTSSPVAEEIVETRKVM